MRSATRVTAKAGTPRPAAGLHWPEYVIEAALLATFLVVAMCAVALIEHPASPLHAALPDQRVRRIAIAIAMGVTVIAIVYSPWGKRSGAHVNPAVTLTFLRLGRIAPRDALAYVVAQCAGAIVGTAAAIALLGQTIAGHPAVGYVQTRPGPWGNVPALLAEGAISFGLMLAVLVVSNDRRIGRWTGVVAAILVAAYISVESPISGTSMNPARSLGPALAAGRLDVLWIYLAAPLCGMLAAAEVYVRWRGAHAVLCCKLHHANTQPCIFRCRYDAPPGPTNSNAAGRSTGT